MSEEFLGDRKKALEESFFAKQNARLLERLRTEREQEAAAEGLSKVCGITDRAVLASLVELGIGPETWAALCLVPLVEVAWADGEIAREERRALLSAAGANGVAPGTPSYAVLESWLEQRPDSRLMQAWAEYTVDVCARLSDAERESLERDVVGRARAVAEAAGGILGFGNRVSAREEVILNELGKAFSRQT